MRIAALHQPVLLSEFLEFSNISASNPKIWDGTLGLGGHLAAFLGNHDLAVGCGSDCDQSMLALARENLRCLPKRLTLTHANFSENPFSGRAPFDVILLDLGISSVHLDSSARGFSYRHDEILDMRFNTELTLSASAWLSCTRESEVADVIHRYSDERHARLIAASILEFLSNHNQITTFDLKNICQGVYARRDKKNYARHTGRHPYVKTFQAIRMHVNSELTHLTAALEFLPGLLAPGGRLIIISFHSLEDRLVKHAFRNLEKIPVHDPTAKSSFREGDFRAVTKKPITPTPGEIEKNSRGRSAKMRVLERVGEHS